MKAHKFSILLMASLLAATACARNLSSNNYTESAISGVVLEGVIVSARPVTISGTDKLGSNEGGAVSGGVAGGLVGSTIGAGKGSVIGAVGGVIIGAVAGATLEDQLSKADGMEYIIKAMRYNNNELISVVQGKDQIFAKGRKVYIVYSGDRPRVVPRD